MKKHLSIVLGMSFLVPTVANACKLDTVDTEYVGGCVETRGVYDCSGTTVYHAEHHDEHESHRNNAPYFPLGSRLQPQRLPDRVRVQHGVVNYSSSAINSRMRIHHGARRGSTCIPTILGGVNVYNDCRSSTLLEHDVRYRVE